MIRSRTCFIVGAGASAEIGLPAGAGLKSSLRNTLDLRFSGNQLQKGSNSICEALLAYCAQNKEDINDYVSACRLIAHGMDQAASIDNFLHAHAGDRRIELCGKLGIADTILRAEGNCSLTLREIDGRQGLHPLYGNFSSTWYPIFFQALVEDVQRDAIDDIFQNVSFVTFNYDRCIEHYLLHSLADYYNIDHKKAAAILQTLKVYHAYGKLGDLSWQWSADALEFGWAFDGKVLLSASSRLRTFTEGMSDSELLTGITDALCDAENVIFLGFAFHRLNMQLLHKMPGAKNILGTSDGLSDYDKQVIQQDFNSRYSRGIELVPTRCASLLASYKRMLTK